MLHGSSTVPAAVHGPQRIDREILDRTEVLEAFEDTPWVPSDLKEVVDAALGCIDLTIDPSELFRPPGA